MYCIVPCPDPKYPFPPIEKEIIGDILHSHDAQPDENFQSTSTTKKDKKDEPDVELEIKDPVLHEPIDIGFIEWGIQLVEHAEGARLDLINGEEKRHGGHGLLSAREE